MLSNVKAYVYHAIFHVIIYTFILLLFVQRFYDNQPILSDNHQIMSGECYSNLNTQKKMFRLPSYYEQKVLSVSALESYDIIDWLQQGVSMILILSMEKFSNALNVIINAKEQFTDFFLNTLIMEVRKNNIHLFKQICIFILFHGI